MLSVKKNKKIPLVVALSSIVIVAILVLVIGIGNFSFESQKQIDSLFYTNKQKYKVGESVFISATRIPFDEKGYVYFTDPNDEIFHKIYYDGSKKSSQTDYFKLESIVTDDCNSCNLVGTWKMEYNVLSGKYYKTKTFEVMQ